MSDDTRMIAKIVRFSKRAASVAYVGATLTASMLVIVAAVKVTDTDSTD